MRVMMMFHRCVRRVASQHRVLLHLDWREDLRGLKVIFEMRVSQCGLRRSDISRRIPKAFWRDGMRRKFLIQRGFLIDQPGSDRQRKPQPSLHRIAA
jgi:hypothetical protein